VYRRLDPEYFAWLRTRMFTVKRALEAGQVSPAAFDELRARFNAVQTRAIDLFGEAALVAAVGSFDLEVYRPPVPEPAERSGAVEPAPARRNPEAERLAHARELVDEIREKALAVGWTMDSLYFSDGYERRPFARKYGLVCYLGAEDRIGEVARESVEIIGLPPAEARTRFYNLDVEQPWAKYVRDERGQTPGLGSFSVSVPLGTRLADDCVDTVAHRREVLDGFLKRT